MFYFWPGDLKVGSAFPPPLGPLRFQSLGIVAGHTPGERLGKPTALCGLSDLWRRLYISVRIILLDPHAGKI